MASQTMEATCSHLLNLLLLSFLLLFPQAFAADGIADTFSKSRNITDNATLVSADGAFTMGFFSPGVSTRRYLGIWFTVSRDAVCWVANRDRPINDNSGVLMISDTGSLLLLDGSGRVAWSSNSTSTSPVEAQLRNSGDLVLRNQGGTIVWHSFDHPSHVLLSGMKVGRDFWSGDEWYLTSWRSPDDPSPGAFVRKLGTNGGVPDNVVWQGNAKTFRTGPWNGKWFSGIPEVLSYTGLIEYQMVISPREVTYGYVVKPNSPFTYVVLTDTGMVKRLVWEESRWKTYYQGPRDVCDEYGKCGAFGMCNASAAATSFCGCLRGFSPASPSAPGGCRRNNKLVCGGGRTTDGFLRLPGVKLPDTQNATVDKSISVEECRARCLANCSCLAYAAADIQGGGGAGTGCIMWTDDLIDLRYVDHGQDMYLRLAQIDLPVLSPAPSPSSPRRPFPTAVVAGASVASLAAIIVLVLAVVVIRRRKRTITPAANNPATAVSSIGHQHSPGTALSSTGHQSSPRSLPFVEQRPTPAPIVPSVELYSLMEATGNFSESNIIGRGGFGIVYEGHLPDGRTVAVKRHIQPSIDDETGEAFMREVEVMSNLRHGNLVQLLAYCNERNERILVYEYMKNRSLNIYIFGGDPRLRSLLNWERRQEIIRGVAKGVAYLHGLSKEVIHRDLKPSNILLDHNWRPKIADFGTAKRFVVDQTDPTLIQSVGYTAPEYIMERLLTLKCDVYSFGVILMEIVSGQRNSITPTLLSNAWESWNQHKINELLDPAVAQPEPELLFGLERCIQIGLLCVQRSPDDRPDMSAVVAMLNNNNSQIRLPGNPMLDSRTGSPLIDADTPTQFSNAKSSTHEPSNTDTIYLT
ncbi:hypothetical protein ACP70R_010387 [Stipagrostis hirtigluma subsp. patula]